MKPEILRQDPDREFMTPERCFIQETWGAESDSIVSVARARVEPGVTTQLHALDGIDERYLILEGSGQMEVGGEAPVPVSPGDAVLIPAGVSQRIANVGRSDLVFYCVCTPPFHLDAYRNLEEA
jgi:mannose-6-phosphate isomerase-like protein (cupin superfamily)